MAVLGISNREDREVIMDKDGGVKAIVQKPLPSHDTETCSVCGHVFEFPSLGDWRPDDDEEFEFVSYRYGPPSWPENAEENVCLRPKNYREPSSRW